MKGKEESEKLWNHLRAFPRKKSIPQSMSKGERKKGEGPGGDQNAFKKINLQKTRAINRALQEEKESTLQVKGRKRKV